MIRRPPRSTPFPTRRSSDLVANADDGTLLGATLVGPRAGDLIEQAALAIEMGATLTDLSEILYAHPGLSETLLEARSEEHTSELQSHLNIVCRLRLEKKKE